MLCSKKITSIFLIQFSQQQPYKGGAIISPDFYERKLIHEEEEKQAQVHITSEVAELKI